MLNHCHDANKANTELMTFGECIDQSSEDGEKKSFELNRKDMILVLSKDVELGEELLTQYEIDIESEEIQLKLLLQYESPHLNSQKDSKQQPQLQPHHYLVYTNILRAPLLLKHNDAPK